MANDLRFRTAIMSLLFSLLAACGGADEAVPMAGVIQLSEVFTGEYELLDTKGATVSSEDHHGKVPVIYFGFASCPDVCPLALGRLSAALDEMDDKTRAEIRPIFITVDPKRDTPEALSEYLAFDERIAGLTGDEAAIDAARQAFKVYAAEERLEDSALGYTMNHTSLFYVVDRKGKPRVALQDTMTPEEIAAYLNRAVKWR